ncbi:MAG: hypothetical protein KF819_31555 [Labilithrix sp.]|nr:hypothetical protein [Labilithrix sp.]
MRKPIVMTTATLGTAALVAVFAACSSGKEQTGEVSFALTRVELPKSARVVYEMRQPELGGPAWRERVEIGPAGDAKRTFAVTTIDGSKEERVSLVTDRAGTVDQRTPAAAIWRRVDAFSAPDTMTEGATWRPDRPALFGTPSSSNAFVNDYQRTYRVVKSWEVPGGHAFRAIYNVGAVIDETSPYARKHGLRNETWSLRDAVFGVGVADYFVTGGAEHHAYLLGSAEYLFDLAAPDADLAVESLHDLGARLHDVKTVVTLRCMVEGPPSVLAIAREPRDASTAFDLNLCRGK